MCKLPMVGINPPEGRTRWMEGDMTPVAHDAGARLSPRIASLSGQIVPMKRLSVELAFRPRWKRGHRYALTQVRSCCARTMGRLRENILKCLIGPYANQEDSSAVLR